MSSSLLQSWKRAVMGYPGWNTYFTTSSCDQTIASQVKEPEILPSSTKIEEETSPDYDPKHFYPVRIGQTFNNRYHVLGKLGAGGYSTVWLVEDTGRWWWQSKQYFALKMSTNSPDDKAATAHEVDISRRVTSADPKHKGYHVVRHLHDSFEVEGPDGTHTCLVLELLREPLWLFQQHLRVDYMPQVVLKPTCQMILDGLDYLHTKCHVIHTDLKSDNIMLKLESDSVVNEYVKAEIEQPCPRKMDGDRIIYLSRNNFGKWKKTPGPATISDFGVSAWGDSLEPRNYIIQPICYRAPEVILGASWSYSADIWNLGTLVWELLERKKPLFCANQDSDTPEIHLAEMIALLGPPPKKLLDRGTNTPKFFDDKGNFLFPELIPKNFTFEELEVYLDSEDKELFIDFIKCILHWLPEDRKSAKELVDHPWLTTLRHKL
ncbi:hypothetical protein MMC18_004614 [Xylographa bjoerkii]|nr:hypothetical protein [Xylographa bjoerkii]